LALRKARESGARAGQRSSTTANALIQATILKKCDRAGHRPVSNKQCANGTCQHTCEPAQVETCPHKWTVRYSVNSRQREQSFANLTEAQTLQLTLSTGKQTQGAMFTDPKAGNALFLPLCGEFINGMARASENSKKAYRSNFANPEVTKLLAGKSAAEAARMRSGVQTMLNKTLGHLSDDYRGNVRRIIVGTLDECVRNGIRYLHLCWQASRDGRKLEPLKHRQAGDFRDIPVPDMVWDKVQALPDGPLCPGIKTPYMPYCTARDRFTRIMDHLGIEGAHTHSLRHQFASEALDADPRELANISQVLGHDSVETTLRFYIHASANAEQRIGAMMNARWTASPAPAAPKIRAPRKHAAARMLKAARMRAAARKRDAAPPDPAPALRAA